MYELCILFGEFTGFFCCVANSMEKRTSVSPISPSPVPYISLRLPIYAGLASKLYGIQQPLALYLLCPGHHWLTPFATAVLKDPSPILYWPYLISHLAFVPGGPATVVSVGGASRKVNGRGETKKERKKERKKEKDRTTQRGRESKAVAPA